IGAEMGCPSAIRAGLTIAKRQAIGQEANDKKAVLNRPDGGTSGFSGKRRVSQQPLVCDTGAKRPPRSWPGKPGGMARFLGGVVNPEQQTRRCDSVKRELKLRRQGPVVYVLGTLVLESIPFK